MSARIDTWRYHAVKLPAAVEYNDFLGVWGVASHSGVEEVWAVGADGAIVHIVGDKVTIEGAGLARDVTLTAVWGFSADDVWAVGSRPSGSGVVLHRTAGRWCLDAELPDLAPADVWGTHIERQPVLWVVGRGARAMLRRGPGPTAQWVPVDGPAGDVELTAIAGSGLFAFAVGVRGHIVRMEGDAWHQTTSPTNETLRGLAMPASQGAVTVGEGGAVLLWGYPPDASPGEGRSWIWDRQSPLGWSLYAVWGQCPNAWAVGQAGAVFHCTLTDGAPINPGWTLVDVGATGPLRGVWAFTNRKVYFVGTMGQVICGARGTRHRAAS